MVFMEDVYTKNDINKLAKELVEGFQFQAGAQILLLEGDLGAGKTTFTKELAKELGVEGNVVSPTFVIQKRYPTKHEFVKNLIHIDAYRLSSSKELLALGWEEWVMNPENLVVVEWPERVSDILPQSAQKISFTHINEETRKIKQHGK